jgi:hypothetical protein
VRHLETVALAIWLGAWSWVGASLVLSIIDGHVSACIPHLSGCTSVSATGRHGWGYFAFKASMLPVAGLTLVFWTLCHAWLQRVAHAHPQPRLDLTMLLLGTAGALSLVLYVTFLGARGEEYGDVYRALRRYGTVVCFGCTYCAELLLTRRLRALAIAPRAISLMVALGAFTLIEGLTLGALANLVDDDDALENLVEWHFTTALTGYFGIIWWIWRSQPPIEGTTDVRR